MVWNLGVSAHNLTKTHAPEGSPLTSGDNLRRHRSNGKRVCKACARLQGETVDRGTAQGRKPANPEAAPSEYVQARAYFRPSIGVMRDGQSWRAVECERERLRTSLREAEK